MRSWISLLGLWFLVVIGQCVSIDASVWENAHYSRTLDLSKAYVKETALVEAVNIAETPQNTYFFAINDGIDAVPAISIISAVLGESSVEVDPVLVAPHVYQLSLPYPVSPGSSVELKIRYVYTKVLAPFPAKIAMDEAHQVLLKLNKYAYSPYATKDYSLNFVGILKGQEMDLHSPDIVATPGLPDLLPRVENKALVYGPVLGPLPAYLVQPMGLLYQHDRPIGKVNNLHRDVWLPALDADVISIEEYYELTNDAAALSGGFSRVDWMKGRYETTRRHFAISALEFPLVGTNKYDDYYFSDKVGMVSTHQFAQNHLLLLPRYPIFGSWNYNFTLGWNNKRSDHVHRAFTDDDTYVVKVPLLNTLRDVFYDDSYISFYLPEGAEFVNVSSPVAFESLTVDNELSYLDVSKGHVKVTVHYKDLVDDLSKVDIFLVYKYTAASYWIKVLKIAGFVFAGLTSYYLLGLLDVSIEKKKA